jgi:hypothetical protein
MAAVTGNEHRCRTTAAYNLGDILLHEQFEKGVGLKRLAKKCSVLFQDKERLMASANEACGYFRSSPGRSGHG